MPPTRVPAAARPCSRPLSGRAAGAAAGIVLVLGCGDGAAPVAPVEPAGRFVGRGPQDGDEIRPIESGSGLADGGPAGAGADFPEPRIGAGGLLMPPPNAATGRGAAGPPTRPNGDPVPWTISLAPRGPAGRFGNDPPRVAPGEAVVYDVRVRGAAPEPIGVRYDGRDRVVLTRDGRPVPLTAHGEWSRANAHRYHSSGSLGFIGPRGGTLTVFTLPVHETFDLGLPGVYALEVRSSRWRGAAGPVRFEVRERPVGAPRRVATDGYVGQVVSPDGDAWGERLRGWRAGLRVFAAPPPDPAPVPVADRVPADFEAGDPIWVKLSLSHAGLGPADVPVGPVPSLWRFSVRRLAPAGELPTGPLPLTEWGTRRAGGTFGELETYTLHGGIDEEYHLSRAVDCSRGGRLEIAAERLIVTPDGDLRTLRTNAVVVTVRRPDRVNALLGEG